MKSATTATAIHSSKEKKKLRDTRTINDARLGTRYETSATAAKGKPTITNAMTPNHSEASKPERLMRDSVVRTSAELIATAASPRITLKAAPSVMLRPNVRGLPRRTKRAAQGRRRPTTRC